MSLAIKCGDEVMKTLNTLASAHTRRAVRAAVGQLGIMNLGRALFAARREAARTGATAGQWFHPSLWKVLGDREAVIDGESRISFSEFGDRVLRTANALHELGLRPGDSCAVLMYNGATWFQINQACNISGFKMPMLNWHLNPNELVHCVNISRAKVLVIDPEFCAAVRDVRQQLAVDHILVTGDGDIPSGMEGLDSVVAEAAPKIHPGKFHISSKAYSGGTTGTPKFIDIDQASLLGEHDAARRGASREEAVRMTIMQLSALGWYGLGELRDAQTGNARSLVPGPLYHAGVQVAVLPFLFGGTVVPMRKFSPEGFLKTIQDERINWTFVAPTMLERVLALPDDIKHRYRLSSMRTLICAAAPCPAHVKREVNRLFRRQGAPDDVFHEYYGASETGIITILLPRDYQEDPERYRSVGKVRTAECRIFDDERKSWAPAFTSGKVLLRSALTFGLQYAGDQKKADASFMWIDGSYWYDDGLVGYLDEHDFLYLTSREKEMIISGGVNVFPNEIEEIIKTHPAVLDVAVVRAPDGDLGEVPAAMIQLRDGMSASADQILEHCRTSGLYGFKLPRRIEFVDLPRNLAGKLPKRQLEDRLWQGVERIG